MTMIEYTASNFKGLCRVDPDFVSSLDKMNRLALAWHITIHVTSSYRVDANVRNAIVTPATHSNHMIGHAIDCNLETHDGMYFNSRAMADAYANGFSAGTSHGDVYGFISDCIEKGLRWGGKFGKPDPVHFDDDLYHKNAALWTEKYNRLHNQQP